jgi:RNA polymerase sigma-70 factor (ECF subfamily)
VDGEERRLVERCLAGDEAACAELVRLHSRVIGTIIWRATGNEGVVEDLAQETFLRAFRALPLFVGDAKLSTWLCTIAHRVAIDHVRKTARQRESPLPRSEEEQDALLDRQREASADPEALVSKAEAEHLVRTYVKELPDKYRLPLIYAAVEGLDYATIGAMLNMPVGTVKTLVFRAKQMLKMKIAAAVAVARQ